MKKHGFMLIELIVATLIASMVAGILLTALAQGNRFQLFVDNTIDTSVRMGVVQNQLEKDLMGAFIPTQADPSFAEASEGKEKKEQKKERVVIEKIFHSTNKEGNLDTLTCITNNPLQVFVGKDVGVVKPRAVRVQYTLKPDTTLLRHPSTGSGRAGEGLASKKSYTLYRQESNELDLAQYKNVRAYEVIGGIKSCAVTFTARIEKKQEAPKAAEGAQAEPQKKSYEYKTSSEWVSEQPKKEAGKEQEMPRIPFTVEFKMILWDKQDKKEKEFTFVCEIPTDTTPVKREKPKKQEEEAPKLEIVPDKADESKDKQQTVVFNAIESLTHTLESLTQIFGQM